MIGEVVRSLYPAAPAEAWAYASGLCAAREISFISTRFVAELGELPAAEAASRIARTWFGPLESITEFDRAATRRLAAERAQIAAACPTSLVVDLVRLRESADGIRGGIGALPARLDAGSLRRSLRDLALRAGYLAGHFAAALDRAWPSPEDDARSAAALAVDRAELDLVRHMSDHTRDPAVGRWADVRICEGCARVAERALALGAPRELLSGFFFFEPSLSPRAGEFLFEYTQAGAAALYPDGVTAGNADDRMREASGASSGEPFSPGRVLHYLEGFEEQLRQLRLAVYRATGRIAREAA